MKKILVRSAFTTLVVLLFNCSNSEDSNNISSVNTTRPTPPITALEEVQIGTQIWSTKNLNVTKYSDGTPITQVSDPFAWRNLTTGAWCYVGNNQSNDMTYGKLYNWYAVAGIYDAASAANPALRKRLAPRGWHIPTDTEWSYLINTLDPNAMGGDDFNTAGFQMKSTGVISMGTGLWQYYPGSQGTNSSGFTGLPACYINQFGTTYDPGQAAVWWGSTENNNTEAWVRSVMYTGGAAARVFYDKKYGCSVRCLRN